MTRHDEHKSKQTTISATVLWPLKRCSDRYRTLISHTQRRSLLHLHLFPITPTKLPSPHVLTTDSLTTRCRTWQQGLQRETKVGDRQNARGLTEFDSSFESAIIWLFYFSGSCDFCWYWKWADRLFCVLFWRRMAWGWIIVFWGGFFSLFFYWWDCNFFIEK